MTGPILLVGGEAFTQPFDRFHLRFLRAAASGERPTIAFLPTASERFPDDETEDAAYRLGKMGVAATVPIRTRRDADNPAYADGVEAADVIYLGDGDPGRLVRTIHGTKTAVAIHAAHHRGAMIVGAGAGAAALCRAVPARPDDVPAHPGEPYFRWFPGLGILSGVTILPRYNRTPAIWLRRLKETAPNHAPLLGIDDVTGLVWMENRWTVVGYGRVVVAHALTETSFGTGETVPLPPPTEMESD
ncbi:MAG: Type 1 glutamine amidotransferase-like domain-containing protein [Thermomicrobiales bacterium]